jgi:sterol desaturase/sphingolipid hydroxylase (fatty acid hydroxylase superfamily)
MKLDPVTLATPFFIVAVILEIVLARLGKAKAHYEWRDARTSLLMGLGSTVAGVLTGGLAAGATLWVYRFHLFHIQMTAWWAWVLIFFLEDLCYYTFHRLSHERRVWWASHVNHHTSQHYNLTTALRQTWTGGVALTWLPWLALALLGFPPVMIAIEKGISLVYQFWIHTEAIDKLPKPIEAVFNTPSHHRVHHARNPRYLDRNYAGVLIIWDRLFGTFEPERAEEPVRYGVVKNLGDFNLLKVSFHEWAAIGRDLWRDPKHALGYIFGPPGWSLDGSRQTSAEIKAAWRARTAGPLRSPPHPSRSPGSEKPTAEGEPALSRL